MTSARRLALVAATAAGTAVRVTRTLPSVLGAAAVVTGVAFEEHGGHGWAWVVGGAFGLVMGFEQNRVTSRRPVAPEQVS